MEDMLSLVQALENQNGYKKDYNLYDYKAQDKGFHSDNNWSGTDKVLEGLSLALLLADERQTEAIQRAGWTETNPILGEHPSKGKTRAYFTAAALAQLGLANMLPPGWRKLLQGATIGVEQDVVRGNNRLGFDAIRW